MLSLLILQTSIKERQKEKKKHSPCLLSSLLAPAAKTSASSPVPTCKYLFLARGFAFARVLLFLLLALVVLVLLVRHLHTS